MTSPTTPPRPDRTALESLPPRTVHYVGFRDDRYWNAWRIWRGPRFIHKVWDCRACRDIGPDDIVIFAEGDEHQPLARWNGDDIDERLL